MLDFDPISCKVRQLNVMLTFDCLFTCKQVVEWDYVPPSKCFRFVMTSSWNGQYDFILVMFLCLPNITHKLILVIHFNIKMSRLSRCKILAFMTNLVSYLLKKVVTNMLEFLFHYHARYLTQKYPQSKQI